jgi:O-antigen/teichoic acid export membrane protein
MFGHSADGACRCFRRGRWFVLTDKRNRRAAVAAGFGVFQRLVQIGCTLLLIPILLGTLGTAQFGVWGAAASLAWAIGLVDIGTGSALVTLVARSLARNQTAEARSQITGALTIGSFVSAFFVAIASLAWAGGAWHSGAAPYLIAFTCLALNIPLSAANNLWLALQKGHVAGFWDLVQTIATTVGLIYATTLTNDVRIFVALVYLGLVIAHAGSLAHLFYSHPELRPRKLPESMESIREVAGSGLQFFILGVTGSVSFMFDNVIALQFLGPEASAEMTIAMRICMTAIGLLAVVSQPLWPAFTDAAQKADRRWIRKSLFRGSASMAAMAVAGSAVLMLYGGPLLRLWLHSDLGIGRPLLLAISAWVLSQAVIRVPILLLNGLHLIRFEIGISAVATVVALAMKLPLGRYLGVAGILWATSIAVFVIGTPASIWRIYRWADQAARQELM